MNKFVTLTVATALISSSALGATPENGWWWNQQTSGTGWSLEFQNGTMFASGFIYDDGGNPTWVSGSGIVNSNNQTTVELMRSTGGP
ncbi:hypothetical protein [Nitrosococcus oceani]|uniref:Uncharacterized protein n=2 Tax=Nitrosococcus oceani TaxID=1229 RepID=Q3J9I6_NITOC|nr:hypothetical protein [Nitrosococcus oceani]KFI19114.1 hypothetical protein IB75_10930 [Nitrosococcus oceani C-27]ABA58510.1 hypothetical protein Noc_2050 [Nitrosococcus oceani ATCC 19707]EDZ67186.1 hypothetical protein NOC27_513 [Nitrosococcus oceani AFC27]KFI22281.1 hypothetical protein HW44_10415 [Nitrosococcus oceani]GEM18908.1 hypothetical protein NONS58_02730 [Nitrosococcus oceani]